jgi:heme-degrading monooxygenase HmoA
MILEAFICQIKAGQEAEFEKALQGALPLISQSKGFISLEFQRCLEVKGQYLFLIRWETLEDHTVGFRGSAAYQEWRAALHHFYEPMPTVQHYEAVISP